MFGQCCKSFQWIILSGWYILLNLRAHWRLSTILETTNKKVRINVFWYVKVCIFWKCIQCIIHWDKIQILKNPFRQIKLYKKSPFFFCEPQLITVLLFPDLRFLYVLKHKVSLSTAVCGIFYFWFRFVFIKVYIFVQQNS